MPETNGHHPHDPEYWCAYLAAAIAAAITTRPFEHGKAGLRKALESFMHSRACTVELAEIIRKVKGEPSGVHHP